MSAVTEHAEHEHHGHSVDEADPHHTPSDRQFIKVALFLAVLTAAETATYWIDLGWIATPSLLVMMAVKFFVIILVFMHLKYDSKIFGLMFYIGLGLAVAVYCVFLFTFQFFEKPW
jgi:cytochrome c oxidase subunit IV